MKSLRTLGRSFTAVACSIAWLTLAAAAFAQERGVISDPDGFVNLRAGKSTSSAVITKVKNDEPFKIEEGTDPSWAKVTLRSGQTGWMHRSRIRLHFTKDDLCKPTDAPNDQTELALFGKARGVDYYAVVQRATRGDAPALKQFIGFREHIDGAAGEGYATDVIVVLHLLGDEKFAAFLTAQSGGFKRLANEAVTGAIELSGIIDAAYLARQFPKTATLLAARK